MAPKKKKKQTVAPAAQSGTTTGDVAKFYHRWGPLIIKRRKSPHGKGKVWNAEAGSKAPTDNDNMVTAALFDDELDETSGAGTRLGTMSYGEPKPYDHPLNGDSGELSSKDSPKITDDEDEDKDPRKREKEIAKRIAARNKEAQYESRTRQMMDLGKKLADAYDKMAGGRGKWLDPKFSIIKKLAKEFEMKPAEVMTAFDYAVTEATVSGQALGSPSVGGVAGTDTRFGGPTFEPNYFEETTNAIKNEKTFYSDKNKQVLLPGFEYVEDYANRVDAVIRTRVKLSDLRFSPPDIESVELDDEDNESMEIKRKQGINWKLDGPEKRYKKLLQRLRKEHNI